MIFIPRPNAPTGTLFGRDKMRRLCEQFSGVVLIDEAYADFAEDNCVDFVKEYPNVVVSRTLSKSYSLAGVRLGFALAHPEIIDGMMKVKDSYNVNMLTQKLSAAAILDREYFLENIGKIKRTRGRLEEILSGLGFAVVESSANFVFASPPDGEGERLYLALKEKGILVRWFAGERTGRYVRITVGTDEEIDALEKELKIIYG
jgi:histidinol-phosphate aminotransferase